MVYNTLLHLKYDNWRCEYLCCKVNVKRYTISVFACIVHLTRPLKTNFFFSPDTLCISSAAPSGNAARGVRQNPLNLLIALSIGVSHLCPTIASGIC